MKKILLIIPIALSLIVIFMIRPQASELIIETDKTNILNMDLSTAVYLGDGVYKLYDDFGLTITYNVYNGDFVLNGIYSDEALGKTLYLFDYLPLGDVKMLYKYVGGSLNYSTNTNTSYFFILGNQSSIGNLPVIRNYKTDFVNDKISDNFDNTLSSNRLRFYITYNGSNNIQFDNYTFKLQIEQGSQATDYVVPYQPLQWHKERYPYLDRDFTAVVVQNNETTYNKVQPLLLKDNDRTPMINFDFEVISMIFYDNTYWYGSNIEGIVDIMIIGTFEFSFRLNARPDYPYYFTATTGLRIIYDSYNNIVDLYELNNGTLFKSFEVSELYTNMWEFRSLGLLNNLEGIADNSYNSGYDEGYHVGIEQNNLDAIYNEGYNKGKDDGIYIGNYEGYKQGKAEGLNEGYNKGISENVSTGGFAMILSSAFVGVGTILSIELLPNVSIGSIVAVPIIFGIVYFILGKKKGD